MNRINARLDPQSAADLELIRRELGTASLTEALKYSLREVAARLRGEAAPENRVMQTFLDSDYVGCAMGPEDLSENYKGLPEADLRAKHGLD